MIKAVSTGTLKIGANAGAATAWVVGTNDIVDAANNAYWTPPAGANGILNAFTVVALDNGGAESTSDVQAQVIVNVAGGYTKLDAAGNDLPTGATEWTCVRDNDTGLIWEVKTDDWWSP